MKFRLNNKEATFDVCSSMKQKSEIQSVSAITHRSESGLEVQIEETLGVMELAVVIIHFEGDSSESFTSWWPDLIGVNIGQILRNWTWI